MASRAGEEKKNVIAARSANNISTDKKTDPGRSYGPLPGSAILEANVMSALVGFRYLSDTVSNHQRYRTPQARDGGNPHQGAEADFGTTHPFWLSFFCLGSGYFSCGVY
jgi:hypothetical protein